MDKIKVNDFNNNNEMKDNLKKILIQAKLLSNVKNEEENIKKRKVGRPSYPSEKERENGKRMSQLKQMEIKKKERAVKNINKFFTYLDTEGQIDILFTLIKKINDY